MSLTRTGRAAAARAEAILDEPPPELRTLTADDLAALVRVLERLADVLGASAVAHRTSPPWLR